MTDLAGATLIAPVGTRGLNYQQNAARRVVREAAGYLCFIQEYTRTIRSMFEESSIIVQSFCTKSPGSSRISAYEKKMIASFAHHM